MLNKVWGIWYPLEKPIPGSGGGGGLGRASNPSQNTGKKAIELGEFIKIYPNPASDKLNVEVENNDITEISVTNVNGQVLLKHRLTSEKTSIDLSSLPNGIYFINSLRNNVAVSTNKIVIIR